MRGILNEGWAPAMSKTVSKMKGRDSAMGTERDVSMSWGPSTERKRESVCVCVNVGGEGQD